MSSFLGLNITLISLLISLSAAVIGVIAMTVALAARRPRPIVSSGSSNDTDVIALLDEFRAREKKLEERLIDQKVKLEILELKMSRGETAQKPDIRVTEVAPLPIQKSSLSAVRTAESKENLAKLSALSEITEPVSLPVASDGNPRSSSVNLEILQIVHDSGGRITAREIQEKIKRSREHTSRTLNLLYKQGLILRNQDDRPFTYSISDTGRRAVSV